MPSGGRVREQDQRQVFRLMAKEKAHGFVDGVVGDKVVVVDHQVQRLVPVGQLDKQLGEQRRQAGVLMLLAQRLALDAAAAAGLLQRGDQVAGEALRLVVALIQGIPAQIGLAGRPLGDQRGFPVSRRAIDQCQAIVARAGQFGQQAIADHGILQPYRAAQF